MCGRDLFVAGGPTVLGTMLVPLDRRFAQEGLAEFLSEQNAGFQPFDVWSDIANYLVEQD